MTTRTLSHLNLVHLVINVETRNPEFSLSWAVTYHQPRSEPVSRVLQGRVPSLDLRVQGQRSESELQGCLQPHRMSINAAFDPSDRKRSLPLLDIIDSMRTDDSGYNLIEDIAPLSAPLMHKRR